MNAKRALQNKTRKEIFRTIHDANHDVNTSIKFNDIKNSLGLRSNDLAYHINILLEAKLITKIESIETTVYELSQQGKTLYPYLSIISEHEEPLLVISSVALLDVTQQKIYLQKKPREPDKGKLFFFGSKVLANTLIEIAAVEHVREQAGCEIDNLTLRCINEFMKKDGETIIFHGVIYFFTATPITKPTKSVIEKDLRTFNSNELSWDNKLFYDSMLHNETVQVIKTIL